jgi:ABC-2 type transport system ATP-binding protein
VIHLSGVTKRYGSEEALRDVTLDEAQGVIGLLGPNGAGKSTLLKVLLGMVEFEGDARIAGLDPRTQPLAVRAHVGFMPEGDCLLTDMTAFEMCAYAAELSGLPRSEATLRAHQTLDFVGLGDKRHQKTAGYSTGMKQKVKLAQALVHDPNVVLLDEPTAGLDPRAHDEVLALVRDVPRKRGGALVLSSHLLGDIETVCDRVIVLGAGRVRFAGALAELRRARDGHVVTRVRGALPPYLAALRERGCTGELCDGDQVRVQLPAGGRMRLVLEAAAQAGVQLRLLEPEQRTLEAAFLEAVAHEPAPPSR